MWPTRSLTLHLVACWDQVGRLHASSRSKAGPASATGCRMSVSRQWAPRLGSSKRVKSRVQSCAPAWRHVFHGHWSLVRSVVVRRATLHEKVCIRQPAGRQGRHGKMRRQGIRMIRPWQYEAAMSLSARLSLAWQKRVQCEPALPRAGSDGGRTGARLGCS